ncbi:flagellar biosynthesis protein FlhF [Peribacillus alkalitolerans]|uniref:flagellar biosynthesis protein FlhF n=1 Tax=Peribacillus alkalitolerans TaxID=1550385 RepID=UPI0013D785D8|nr:flagellar biosynthesis protein FlhF [Peribacillus alkalitolerans]
MKVKKFVAPSMGEAMKLVRSELGNEAVILNSKVVYSGGFLGLFKKRSIEVIAGVDSKQQEQQVPKIKEKTKKISLDIEKSQLPTKEPVGIMNHSFEPQGDILKEINELKQIVNQLNQKSNQTIYPEILEQINVILNEQEISDQHRVQLMEELLAEWSSSKEEWTIDSAKEKAMRNMLGKLQSIMTDQPLFKKKFINVVGPTGVGKTTTLAKLAAEQVLKHQKKVAFITTDTYRIAAIDQLQTYAKILNVPIEIAYNLEDFQKAAQRFSHYDLVFIDTAGRNFRNQEYVRDLMKIIDFENDMETYLVLSLTSKQKDMEDIYHQFSLIPIHQVIFTKMDETHSFGSIYNMILNFQFTTAYITNGQNVPEDIVKAQPESILNIIFGAENI